MKNLLFPILCFFVSAINIAEAQFGYVQLGNLPLGSAASTNSADSFPYVSSVSNHTQRLTFGDIINLPEFSTFIIESDLGNLTDSGTDGITVTGGTAATIGNASLSQHKADSTHNGYLSSADWITFNAGGSGSVTSVGLSAPGFLTVSGSPVTSTGTLALSYSGTALPIANGGTGATAATGSGNVVLASSPTLISPALGTPTALVGTNISGTASSLTSGLATAPASGSAHGAVTLNTSGNFQSIAPSSSGNILTSNGTDWVSSAPATAGTVTSIAQSVPTSLLSISGSPITTSGTLALSLATQSAATYFGGPYTGSAAAPTFKAFQVPTVQRFTSGSGTYTTPSGVLYIIVEMVGAGGGGGGGGSTQTTGVAGTNTTFGASLTAGFGNPGNGASYGTGGTNTVSTGTTLINVVGGGGGFGPVGTGAQVINPISAFGGTTIYGGAGIGATSTAAGGNAAANSGAGGSGGGSGSFLSGSAGGGSGGAGGAIRVLISSPSSTYSYVVGAGGAGGAAGTNGGAGGNGGSGVILVMEYYQ